jgi:UDP:flavonoid glycosyltransferase YjiC (YdhE family)
MVAAGAHGHVNPNLPVITELVARGHRVQYAVVVDAEDVTIDALRRAAAALDDDEVRRRCAEAAEELRAAGGAAHAADVIEEVASPGQHHMLR